MKMLLVVCVFLSVAGSVRAAAAARSDFCLDGWISFRGNCYYLNNSPDTWSNAENFCGAFGSSLASVHNMWEHRFLQRNLQTAGHTWAWTGGYYFQGNWKWEDGSLFDYNKWESEVTPDHYQCLQITSQASKGWSNQDCSLRFPFICQMRPNC